MSRSEQIAQQGELTVERDSNRRSGRLLLQRGMEASYVDLADETHLEFDYMRWCRIILLAARAERVLHIGGGACALARALAAARPSSRQVVFEVDADVLAVAREHLGLRRARGLRVRHGEGRAAIAGRADQSADAIVIDAFIGATVPRHLITVEAFTQCARVAPLTLVNVVDDRRAREIHLIAAGLAAVYPETWLLGRRGDNSIVVGAADRLDLVRIAREAAADLTRSQLTAPEALAPAIAATAALRDRDLPGQAPAVWVSSS